MSLDGDPGIDPEPGSDLEKQLQSAARAFDYPETPDIVRGLKRRWTTRPVRRPGLPRLAWAAAVLLAVIAGLFAVPQVRARVLDWIRLGAVRIFLVEPTPAPTVRPTPVQIASLLNLAGETTLEEAEKTAGFDLRLPAEPPDLGRPDRVYLQDLGGPAVVLVWVDENRPDQVRLSLFELGPGTSGIDKIQPKVIQETQVNDARALWTEGPHFLQLRNGEMDLRSLVAGNTLIWVADGVTYRLETDQSMEEAVRIAESVE